MYTYVSVMFSGFHDNRTSYTPSNTGLGNKISKNWGGALTAKKGIHVWQNRLLLDFFLKDYLVYMGSESNPSIDVCFFLSLFRSPLTAMTSECPSLVESIGYVSVCIFCLFVSVMYF